MRLAAQLFSCKKVCGSFLFLEKAPADFWSASLKKSLPTPSKKIRRRCRVPKKNTKKWPKMAKNWQKNGKKTSSRCFETQLLAATRPFVVTALEGHWAKNVRHFFGLEKFQNDCIDAVGAFFGDFWRLFGDNSRRHFFQAKKKGGCKQEGAHKCSGCLKKHFKKKLR